MKISPIQNSNMSFKGIYKVPAKSITDDLEQDVYRYKMGLVPSSQIAPEYFYIIAPNNKKIEQELEQEILYTGGKYWKSKPIKEIANRKLCEQIFNLNKSMDDNKENWIQAEDNPRSTDDVPF